jgi:spore germination cell wall hydrolase CwlJ-like protein
MNDPYLLLRRFAIALCVWREARGESLLGMLLVAQVIENRVTDPRWPDTYISVITQPLQFSAFNKNDPQVVKYPKEDDRYWLDCVAATDLILSAPKQLTSANHYHARSVQPNWADTTKITNKEGNHIFYKL